MIDSGRRDFLRTGLIGLAAAGIGGRLVLPANAEPTPPSGDVGDYGGYGKEKAEPPGPEGAGDPTEKNILGPFYREGAPYRAKVTPPLARGTILLITGRVWGHDTKKPLQNVVIDVWQANADGRYDNDDPKAPPAKGVYLYRTRMITDENGAYEYETIHPGRYSIGQDIWRPSHIHYMVKSPGYRTLVTQLYFKGDPENDTDAFIRPSLIIELKEHKSGETTWEKGNFDIILAKA